MQPTASPWGEVQWCKEIYKGVYMLGTASHGGIMVEHESLCFLTPAARSCGFREGSYLCFEEDCQKQVVLRDLLDSGLWSIPTDRVKDLAQYEEAINGNIQTYNPDYWKAREKRMQQKAARRQQTKAPLNLHSR